MYYTILHILTQTLTSTPQNSSSSPPASTYTKRAWGSHSPPPASAGSHAWISVSWVKTLYSALPEYPQNTHPCLASDATPTPCCPSSATEAASPPRKMRTKPCCGVAVGSQFMPTRRGSCLSCRRFPYLHHLRRPSSMARPQRCHCVLRPSSR